MGPGVAQECVESKDGPVIWEDWFYPEIIDPDSGEVLADGEEGELVFTSLTKEALPVIRYRTRDLTRLLPGTARTMRRMAKITGRTDDMLIVRGVNVFPTQIEEHILAVEQLAPHFQLEIRREGHLDTVTILVEMRPETDTEANAESARSVLHKRIKSLVGISCEIRTGSPGSVPRSQGKAQRVVDRRKE
jgi:phenylacetate-CoA ligase